MKNNSGMLTDPVLAHATEKPCIDSSDHCYNSKRCECSGKERRQNEVEIFDNFIDKYVI